MGATVRVYIEAFEPDAAKQFQVRIGRGIEAYSRVALQFLFLAVGLLHPSSPTRPASSSYASHQPTPAALAGLIRIALDELAPTLANFLHRDAPTVIT